MDSNDVTGHNTRPAAVPEWNVDKLLENFFEHTCPLELVEIPEPRIDRHRPGLGAMRLLQCFRQLSQQHNDGSKRVRTIEDESLTSHSNLMQIEVDSGSRRRRTTFSSPETRSEVSSESFSSVKRVDGSISPPPPLFTPSTDTVVPPKIPPQPQGL